MMVNLMIGENKCLSMHFYWVKISLSKHRKFVKDFVD